MMSYRFFGGFGLALFAPVMSASALTYLNLPATASNENDYAVNVHQGTFTGLPVTVADGDATSYITRGAAAQPYFYGFQVDTKDNKLGGFSLDFYPGQSGFHDFQIYGISSADATATYGTGMPKMLAGGTIPGYAYGHYIYPSTGWKLLGSVTQPGDATTQLPNHVEVSGLTPLTAEWVTMTWTDAANGTPNGNIAALGELGLSLAPPTPPAWNIDSSGDWNVAANWDSGSVPLGAGAEADLGSKITSNRTVYTDTGITIGTLKFNNANTYVVTGSGSLTLDGGVASATVSVVQGIEKISLPLTLASDTTFNVSSGATLKISNPMTINAGKHLTVPGLGTVLYESTVTLQTGATASIASSSYAHSLSLAASSTATLITSGAGSKTVLELDSLTNTGGTLDANNNDLIFHGSANLSSVTAQVASGYSGGTWTGTGITSGVAAGDLTHLHALGVIPAAAAGSFDGKTVATGDVLVKYTYYGDANLDGRVDGSDYTKIDNGYHNLLTGWANGDFNYDGVINGSDYTLIDNAFNTQGAQIASEIATSTAQIAGDASASVPEPTSLGLLGIGAVSLLGRRRRR